MEFYGIVFLVSSVSLFEPLNVHIDDDLGIWLFWQIFSSIASNNYHIQCHNSHGVDGIQEVMYVVYLMIGRLKSIEYLGIRCMKYLHCLLSYNGSRLSHKNGEF